MFESTDSWIKDRIRGISRQSRVTFTATFVAGILAHMYTLTNKLPNYDELTFGAEGIGVTVSSGRWGLEVLHRLSTFLVGGSYSLPWFSGLMAIMFMGLAACYVVKFLDIRRDILCVLTGSVLVVFPAFTCAMFFMFTARYYAFAIFVMAWGLYQFDRLMGRAVEQRQVVEQGQEAEQKREVEQRQEVEQKRKVEQKQYAEGYGTGRRKAGAGRWVMWLLLAWAAGVGCVMAATSIFQAYYPLAAGLCVVKLIQMCLREDAGQYGKVFGKAWVYLAMLAAGVALYIVSAKAAAALVGETLSGYRGVNNMGAIRVEQIPWMIKEVYKSVLLLFTADFYQVNPTVLLRLLLALGCVATVVLAAVCMLPKCREKGGLLLTGELAVFTLVLPFCMNGIIVMQPDSWFYTLMEYGVVIVFICPLAVLSVALDKPIPTRRIRQAADCVITFGLLACVAVYIWFDNGNYVSMDFAYRSGESYFTSMLTQVRMTDGYTDEMPVYVLGWDSEIGDASFSANWELDVFNIAGKNDSLVHAWNWYAFLETYLGYRQFDWDEEAIHRLWSSQEVAEMPCYPDQGSIARMGDGVVIKIAEWQG